MPTFGNLKGHSDEWLTRVLRRCVTAGWVDFTPGDRPVVLLTGAGRAVMKGERPACLVLPREYGRGLLSPPAGRLGARAPEGPPAPKGSGSLPPEAAVLFEALRRLRRELAREDGAPPFVVASDRTLREAHGIGPAKAERYGKRHLEAVAERDPGGAGDHPAT